MAKYSVVNTGVTLTGFANGATSITDSTYPFAIQGATATNRVMVYEIELGGQSTSSAVSIVLAARDGQVATGAMTEGTGLMINAIIDSQQSAPASIAETFNAAATNKPQRSASHVLLNLTHNSFGGIVRWVAPPGNEISIVGLTANIGELSVSAFTGSPGIIGAHMVYETI